MAWASSQLHFTCLRSFFQSSWTNGVGKPTEHLLGIGIRPEHLNDDKLGRVLDTLYEADVTKLFVNLALRAAKRYGVALETIHLDASSVSVHGAYEGEAEEELAEELPVIHLTYGYSREQRPDLKQFVVDPTFR